MKARIVILCLSLVLYAGFVASSAHAAENPIKFKVQTALTATSMYMDILKSFAANLKAMSGGRLQAEMLPAGAVVKTNEIHDAVSSGVV